MSLGQIGQNIAKPAGQASAGMGSLHHVTAIASDASVNAHFYSQILGLRLVKKSVNFDDPGSYHLYYGDHTGSPGSLMTFFIWPGRRPALRADSVIHSVGFLIPAGTLELWQKRLANHSIAARVVVGSANKPHLEFSDPDGLNIYLCQDGEALGASGGGAEIIRIAGVTWNCRRPEKTTPLFLNILHYQPAPNRSADVLTSAGTPSTHIGLNRVTDLQPHSFGPGQIHHVAFRAADLHEQAHLAELLRSGGVNVTGVQPRKYFSSVYFVEPGGGICELATDGPGMSVDEPVHMLGTHLCLPDFLEPQRAEITAALPSFDL